MGASAFFFGLGYSASAIAGHLAQAGWRVAGTVRRPETVPADGVTRHRFDRGHPVPPELLVGFSHILVSVPPDEAGDPVLQVMGDRLRVLAPSWVGYLSTTGVYGDHGGAWVDEATPVDPVSQRSRWRVAAEQAWQDSGLPVHLFRLAGIYGPGRSAFDSIRTGRAHRINKPGQVFSRIHVDDIVATVVASMSRPRPGAIYNVCDDDPASPGDVVAHACALLGRDPPPEQDWDQARATLSPMALSFYADNKRVRNDLIKAELGVRLRYRGYRDGLAAILAAEGPG